MCRKANRKSHESCLPCIKCLKNYKVYYVPLTFIIICDCIRETHTHTYPAGTWRLYNVVSTSMQRHDVASTLMRRYLNVSCLPGYIDSECQTGQPGPQVYFVAHQRRFRPDCTDTQACLGRCSSIPVSVLIGLSKCNNFKLSVTYEHSTGFH